MDADRDRLEREVDGEARKLEARWSRFMRRPLPVRLAITLSLVTLATAGLAAVTLGLDAAAEDRYGPLPLVVGAAIVVPVIVGAAIWAAVSPRTYLRFLLRQSMSYPVSAPGYGTWQGDRSPTPGPTGGPDGPGGPPPRP